MFVEQSYYYIGNLKLTVRTHTSLPPGQILEIKCYATCLQLLFTYLSIYLEKERERRILQNKQTILSFLICNLKLLFN